MASTLNDDDDSFSSDSEDEFLAMRQAGADGGDREAMIRKKLLESFYGKSAVVDPDNRSKDSMVSDDDDDDDISNSDPLKAEDLDAPQFDAAAHTQKHVWGSGVHPLLEIEESLACQVRTLDSRLQTLVYENYSRFIEATDAIRSIDMSVKANEENLSSLQGNMDRAQEASRAVEVAVGPLRDQVVEKIRVKRLLQRLDTLLKLPSTLRKQIDGGKYRLATQSYVSAYSILSKHSAGFESLQRIESDCHGIMTNLLQVATRKLYHWSGGIVPSLQRNDSSDREDEEDIEDVSGPGVNSPLYEEDDDMPLPDPPQNIAEILECAAAPVLAIQSASSLQSRLTLADCQEMALSACLRFLERVLDTHHIELQEQLSLNNSGTNRSIVEEGGADMNLIPTAVLDSILEVATLYAMSFRSEDEEEVMASNDRLNGFLSSAFGLFLSHVQSEVLEQAVLQQQHASQARAASKKVQKSSKSSSSHRKTPSEDAAEGELIRLVAEEAQAEEQSDQYDEQITASMATLLLSVRQLASGLTMVPNGVVSAEAASNLVDQTIGLTEAMVRRRVDQKFYALRLRVVEDCLAPFCQAMKELHEQEGDEEQPPPLLGSIQLASVALSDSLQLVDDTVRSILANLDDDGAAATSEGGVDDSILQKAVQLSTKRFARWLASTMEMLAGYESSTDSQHLLQVPLTPPPTQPGGEDTLHATSSYGYPSPTSPTTNAGFSDYKDDMSGGSIGDLTDDVFEGALFDLLSNHHPTQNVVLAIAEMCRVAERSVAAQIQQSISTHGGGAPGAASGSGRKTAAGTSLGDALFSGDENEKSNSTSKDPISRRFLLAASRIMTLYAMNLGHEAGSFLCSSLPAVAMTTSIDGPHVAVTKVLGLFKSASQDCADIFGGSRRAGPIPESLEDEYTSLTSSRMGKSTNNRSGLVFDVERMFTENVLVYPHPNEIIDFQRNAVLSLVGKVAFQAMAEDVRLLRFSVDGYRQLKVDTEFLKWFLPHFIKEEILADGSNALTSLNSLLTEVALNAKDRCMESDALHQEVEETNLARSCIRSFMSANYSDARPQFCIDTD